MKITADNITHIEHELLDGLEFWDFSDGNAEKSMTYIAGIHDMANAVIAAIKR